LSPTFDWQGEVFVDDDVSTSGRVYHDRGLFGFARDRPVPGECMGEKHACERRHMDGGRIATGM
jgi:hypothetical protein